VQPPAVQLRRLATAVRDSGPLTDLFSTLPYHEALELFNLLRETPRSDMLALVAQASDSDTPATATSTSNTPSPLPPELSVLGSLLPPASRPTEVELMVKHPVAYPVLLPIRASLLPLDDLLIPHSLRTTYITKPLDALLLWTDQGYDDQKHGGSLTSWHGSVPLLKPDWIARLEEVSVSSWTAIPIPDRAAVHAIALYLANDYPVMPLFDADLFLRDLVLNQPYFCSPFLVSALLGWACQAYAATIPEAASWSLAFFAEAEQLWEQYDAREALTLCSISALQLLGMTAETHGRDTAALNYLEKGLDVARAMGLVNVPPGEEAADAWLGDHNDWNKGASYTAWGVFNRTW
jgi:hypothetical protein